MASRQKPNFEERVKEYVDSPMMTRRLRHEKCVSAQIRGNFGSYRTTVDLKAKKVKGECTCPSELQPCKHIHALRATWDKKPESFFNLDDWLEVLPKQSKESLVEAIRNMVLDSPNLLAVFGIPGFEEDESTVAKTTNERTWSSIANLPQIQSPFIGHKKHEKTRNMIHSRPLHFRRGFLVSFGQLFVFFVAHQNPTCHISSPPSLSRNCFTPGNSRIDFLMASAFSLSFTG